MQRPLIDVPYIDDIYTEPCKVVVKSVIGLGNLGLKYHKRYKGNPRGKDFAPISIETIAVYGDQSSFHMTVRSFIDIDGNPFRVRTTKALVVYTLNRNLLHEAKQQELNGNGNREDSKSLADIILEEIGRLSEAARIKEETLRDLSKNPNNRKPYNRRVKRHKVTTNV